MKKELTGLLFDNDGVLIDSMPGALRAWVKWGEVYHPGFALTPEFHGRRASDIVKDMVTPEEFQASYDHINLLEIAESASTRPLPGTLEFLAQLPAGHWNIVTGANPELAKVRLDAAGIQIPETLVTAYDAKNGKPDPEPYLLGAAKIGINVTECAVFEDAPAGLIAGQRAGAALLVGIGEQTLESVADVVIESLSGLKYHGNVLEIPDELRLR